MQALVSRVTGFGLVTHPKKKRDICGFWRIYFEVCIF
jgi:hypothetical protein